MAENPNARQPLAVAAAATQARAALPNPQQMKARYGEITMLDFPTFTKETFPGVTRMDLFSGLFGDVASDAMFFPGVDGRPGGFDPMSPAGRTWLDTLAGVLVKTGTRVQHISNNAPSNLAAHGSPEEDEKRKAGVAMAQALARRLRRARRQVDAHELAPGAGSEHPAQARSGRAGASSACDARFRLPAPGPCS